MYAHGSIPQRPFVDNRGIARAFGGESAAKRPPRKRDIAYEDVPVTLSDSVKVLN